MLNSRILRAARIQLQSSPDELKPSAEARDAVRAAYFHIQEHKPLWRDFLKHLDGLGNENGDAALVLEALAAIRNALENFALGYPLPNKPVDFRPAVIACFDLLLAWNAAQRHMRRSHMAVGASEQSFYRHVPARAHH